MKELNLKPVIMECQMDELPSDEQYLVQKAIESTNNSYARYSHFCVGAAVQLDNGEVLPGCNQENAAFPAGICAERAAIFAAGAQYPEEPVTMLAIACFTGGHFTKEPGSPCGACRQVMLETEHRYGGKMEVLLYGDEATYVFESAADLLPLTFVSENLKG